MFLHCQIIVFLERNSHSNSVSNQGSSDSDSASDKTQEHREADSLKQEKAAPMAPICVKETLLADGRLWTERTLVAFNLDELQALGKCIGLLTCEACADWLTEIGLCGDREQYSLRNIIGLAQEYMMLQDVIVLPLKVKS